MKSVLLRSVLALALLNLVLPSCFAATAKKTEEASAEEKIVSWKQLPSSVEQSLAKENVQDDIRKIIVEEKNHLIYYHVEAFVNGQVQEYWVSISGKLTKSAAKLPNAAGPTDSGTEDLLSWKQVPAPVQKTVLDRAGRDEVRKVVKQELDQTNPDPAAADQKIKVYVVDIYTKGEAKKMQVGEDGAFIKYVIIPSKRIEQVPDSGADDDNMM
jgi:hypothetical protein